MDVLWQTPANPPEAKDYIIRNGRRHVRPYFFEFISHVKNRWEGKNIVDLFAHEFKGRPRTYYVDAVKCGRIQVNGQRVDVSYVVRSSEKISHFLHRHEPPVMALDVSVLHKDSDVVTVCKPASIPVHPCGQYRKNTVVGILQAEHGLFPLFPVHRLDRLVSGLLIFARNAAKAECFRKQVAEQFSSKPVKGKTACTKFTRLCTNGFESLVLCQPITGRSHQIRVHLQYTGHPIANDILYTSDTVVSRSENGLGADRAARQPMPQTTLESGFSGEIHLSDVEATRSEDCFVVDHFCTNCPNLVPKGYEECEEGLWLHCVRYTGPDWSYECPYPDWAVEILGKRKM